VEVESSDGLKVSPVYVEKHCGLPWTGMIVGLLYLTAGAVVTLVTFVLSLTVNRAIFLLTLGALAWDLFWLRYLRSAWTTGIWVDEAGIRIGDARALPYATSASQSVFTCSWTAARRIVLAGRSWRRRPAKGILAWLRWLLALVPRSRAVLVIYADRAAPGGPRAELVDNVFSVGTPPTRWTVSTRRPKALRAALAQVPGCPPVEDQAVSDVP
jgi:hypothetical protein